MKAKHIKTAVNIAGMLLLTLLALWCWQATLAERVLSIRVPRWIAGTASTSYSIAIHKSQLRPWFTIWKATYFDGGMVNFTVSPKSVVLFQIEPPKPKDRQTENGTIL